jgi:Zn ribbon nucleic-acid-binding protein
LTSKQVELGEIFVQDTIHRLQPMTKRGGLFLYQVNQTRLGIHLALQDYGKVEKVTGLEVATAKTDFLRHDLDGGLNANRPSIDVHGNDMIGGQWRCRNEINLAFRVVDLDRAVLLQIIDHPGVTGAVEPRCKESEVLRFWQEDVDVPAEPVAVAQHQDSSTAETPVIIRHACGTGGIDNF